MFLVEARVDLAELRRELLRLLARSVHRRNAETQEKEKNDGRGGCGKSTACCHLVTSDWLISLRKILANQRKKLARAVRLREIAGGARLSRLFPVTAQRKRRNHDDRKLAGADVRLQDPCRIEAGHLGQLYVHEYEIRQFLLRQGHAALAVHRLDQTIRGTAEQLPHDLPVVLVVFDIKDRLLAHTPSSFVRSGTAKKNVQPFPISLSTQMRPPCISTNFFVMLSPRPVPPNSRVTVASTCRNSAKTFSSSSCGIPMPVSTTR